MGRRKLTEEEKALKKQQEVAQRIEELRLREIKDLQTTITKVGQPKTKRKVFEIGEDVITPMSGHISGKVINIISEGVYEVDFSHETTKDYSSEKVVRNGVRVFGWWDLQKPSNKECNIEYKEPLRLQFMQQDIGSLIHRNFVYWGLNMNPRYQRDLVWTDKQKEELLDSIFSGLDIGKFVFINIPYKDEREFGAEILDGKQRLSTILEFYNDELKYKGYYFSELSNFLKYKFSSLGVSVAEMRDDVATKENVLEYFIKLNTTGTPMSKEHLNKIIKEYGEINNS